MARLGNLPSGDVNSRALRAQRGIMAMLYGFDFDARCTVNSFSMAYKSKKGEAVSVIQEEAVFTGRALSLIQRAALGDTYHFSNIKVRCLGDMAARSLIDVTYLVK